MNDPAQAVKAALDAVKLVRRDRLHLSARDHAYVLTANVEPFIRDPQYVIGKLYKACEEYGAPMRSIVWSATSPDFADCQQFQFVIKPLGEE